MNSISARNQIAGKVKSISRGIVNAEVIIVTDCGMELASIITLGSSLRMGLEPGCTVTAIIKASDVILAIGDGFAISSRNCLTGTIRTILPGTINDEIVIDIEGTEIVSVITQSSVSRLGLTEGTKVSAIVKASNVIIMTSGCDSMK